MYLGFSAMKQTAAIAMADKLPAQLVPIEVTTIRAVHNKDPH